ncbi:MAG: TolC family protein [Bacteroidota bacterium]
MKRIILCGLSVAFLWITGLSAQTNTSAPKEFTLKSAQEYARKNSPVLKNAYLDLESAKKKIWETTAIGLPQINSKLAGSYMLKVPDMISEFSSFSSLFTWMYGADQALYGLTMNPGFGNIPAPTPSEPVSENDMKWGLTYDITATQLLFSGAYIVGLQTAKTFKNLSELSISKSENDLTESVSNAYFLCLIVKANKEILDSLYLNTEKIFNDIKAIQGKGFLEETDVDQMQLTLANLNNTRDMISRQAQITENLLKFQMGLDLKENIKLTDNIDALILQISVEAMGNKGYSAEKSPDFRLLETQEKLAMLNVKLQKSTFLPDVAAYFNHQENFNKNSFSFTPPNVLGLSVSIPIFGSGMKLAKIKQAKIGLEKVQNTKFQVAQGLNLQYEETKTSFQNALGKYTTNRQNIELAKKIYTRTVVKYKEGFSSSMEMAQVQNQYLQSQSSYYSAIIELSSAFAKLEKLLK